MTDLKRKQIQLITHILEYTNQQNLFVFIKGGWNIELAIGGDSRDHVDIDFHYDVKDQKIWSTWFLEHGFSGEQVDSYYTLYKNRDGIKIDFEGCEVNGDILKWKHGGTSKIADVVEERIYSGIKYIGMKLSVEKYLKEKRKTDENQLRKKDIQDIKAINAFMSQS